MLTFFGFGIIALLIYFLLRDKMSPMVALITVPVAGILLYWIVMAGAGSPVVSKNYSFLLQKQEVSEFVGSFATKNSLTQVSDSTISSAYVAGLKAVGLKPNAKLSEIIIDNKKLVKFYDAVVQSAYIDVPHISELVAGAIDDLRLKHTWLNTLKDYADELNGYFKAGIGKVYKIAIMFIFAILFFGVLDDAGLFRPLISLIVKIAGGNVIAICVGTVLITMIAHLDGSGATTFLIVIPPLIPVYRHLKINPYLLFLLVASSAGLANMLPWGGPLGRIASVMGVDTISLYHPLIKVQVVGFICILGMAVLLGVRERARLAREGVAAKNLSLYADDLDISGTHDTKPNKFFKINLIVAILTLGLIISGLLSPEFAFMIALCVVLLINYKTPKERMESLKAHSVGAVSMGTILLGAGVYIGILTKSGMLGAIAKALAGVFPEFMLGYLHIITGVFGVPFELLLDTNGYYYTLYPVVGEIVGQYGVGMQEAAYAIMIGSIVGTFVSPFSPALWLGLGLARLNMGRHIRYSLFWLWGLSLFIMLLSHFMGLF
ncbi:CitMHS family transporter [Campylobacter sp. 19-13652]|uniref:CitMHS family transporter n=1 Tax=Campylobacter sp. 19-13652 TaxID=2840180 RepID=UPI001C77FE0E|nr:SLC13 family permease [Campylobacter sp. 19-13652]BCX79487.1 hypothetical protein LBC_09490 [Campylobacter sp. 19-13652]